MRVNDFIITINCTHLYKLDDIRNQAFTPVYWDEKREACKKYPQSGHGKKCYNQIQVVQPLNETHVVICGSNSYSPQNRLLLREVCIYIAKTNSYFS